jgi:hypothetical protein
MARAPAKPGGRDPGELTRRFLSYAILILLTLIFVAPLLWMLSASFKPNPETTQLPLSWIPKEFSTEGYSTILNSNSQSPALRWFLNSMIAGLANTGLILVTASMAAYALARMEFRGKMSPVRGDHLHAVHSPDHTPHAELPDSRSVRVAGHPTGRDRAGSGRGVRGLLPAAVLPRPAPGTLHPPGRLHDELRGHHGRGRNSQHTRPGRVHSLPEVHNPGSSQKRAERLKSCGTDPPGLAAQSAESGSYRVRRP